MKHCMRWLLLGVGLISGLSWGQDPGRKQSPKDFTAPALNPADFHTIKLQTMEVTQPGLAASPDGRSLIFSLLGHLFLVSSAGGEATQLTYGFSFDSEPAVSPNGRQVAFVSDRDGSGGNVFVLDLPSRRIFQITHELQAGSPRWSPDGKTIAYLRRLMREEHPGIVGFGSDALSELKTVPSDGGTPLTIRLPDAFSTIFFTRDGQLGWVIPAPSAGGGFAGAARKMHVEIGLPDGKTMLLGSFTDIVGNAILSPAGDGLYYSTDRMVRHLLFAGGPSADLAPITDGMTQLALAADRSLLFFADRGRLWRLRLPEGTPEIVNFHAEFSTEARKRVESNWTPPKPGVTSPRAILDPQAFPDGSGIVFMAAGSLYVQKMDGSQAGRLLAGAGFERNPALSPDGKKLAFAVSLGGRRELRVYDFETGLQRTVYAVGGASWAALPSWSPDGTKIVLQRSDSLSDPYRLIIIDLKSGASQELRLVRGSWTARPHFSPDGSALYFTERTSKYASLYRLQLRKNATAEPITALSRHVNDGLVSPDGKWFASRTNNELWVAPIRTLPIRDVDLRQVATDCSRSFTFTIDSSAILYSSGRRVWRQPVKGGDRTEVPIRLTLERSAPPPLLVRRVRALDLDAGRFGDEASMLIQDGNVIWIGDERAHTVPEGARVLEAGGRFAIPGLFDVHVHSAWANQVADPDAFIAFGNTSVRDVGSSLDLLHALRDRSETTELPLPRYWYSGEILEGAMPLWGDAFMQISNEEQALHAIRQLKEWGADFVKVYLTVPWHLQNVMAEEAQRQGLPLVGHAISFEEMVRHALQGYATVEHTPEVMHADGRKLMAASGTQWVGTLTCEGGSEIFMREEPPIHMGSELVRQFVPAEKIQAALKGGRLARYPKEYWSANMKKSLDRIHTAYRDGVRVRAGTDALMAEVFFGLSLHWELEFFRMAGLTAPEVLRLGTADAAETVGADSYLGSLEPGKLADVVLLDADPLKDIRNTTTIWRVLKGGLEFDPKRLRRAGDEGQ